MSKWPVVNLREIIRERDAINYGVVQPGEDFPGGAPIIRVGDFRDGKLELGGLKHISPEVDHKHKKSRLVGDELLVSCVGSIGTICLATHHAAGCNIARAVARVPLGDKCDKRYILQVMRSEAVQRYFQKETRTVSQPTLNISLINATPIPLPPLPEQKRIAKILDQADALRAKRREAIAKLDTFLQSTFLDMFGDPVTNPKGWEMKKLGDTNSQIQIGPFGSLLHKEDYITGGVPLINPMHIIDGKISVSEEQSVSETKAATLNGYRLKTGDVVMGRRGEMGRCAIVCDNHQGMLCGTGSLFIRLSSHEYTSLFMATMLSSLPMKKHLEGLSQGVTMPNLNKTMVEKLRTIIPPLQLQQRFADIVAKADVQKQQMRDHLAQLDTLFASLQSRAFNGEL